MEPTLPEEMRTWNIGNPSKYGDWTKYHPWRAPGYSPVSSHSNPATIFVSRTWYGSVLNRLLVKIQVSDPCGRAGANHGQSGGGETPYYAKQFDRGSLLPKLDVVTKWHSGQPAEVGWMVGSNHGATPRSIPPIEWRVLRTVLQVPAD